MNKYKIVVSVFLIIQLSYFFLLRLPTQVNATLTSVSDTLSNSRLSFRSQVASAVSSGATTVTVGAGQSDADVQNLFQRDSVCFADSGLNGCKGTTSYTVGSIPSQSGTTIGLASALTTALTTSDIAVASQSATHTVVFTTASTVNNPIIQVRVPAATQTSTSSDGFPDYGSSTSSNGFDLGGLVLGDVTCSGTGPTWVASVTSSASSGGAYHVITCTGTGTLNSSTTVTITIGGTHKLINPAPVTSGHTRGTADVYNITIRELDGSSNLIDSATTTIAPVEGVLVSATVQNSLSFAIAAVSVSTSTCGKTTNVASTATTVPFGSVTSTSSTPYVVSHQLTVSTNASNGYSVYGWESAALSIDGLGTTTLADTTCPANTCTTTTSADWTTYTASGFGFSLQNVSGSHMAFNYNDSLRTLNSRPFTTTAPSTYPTANIMTYTAPVSGDSGYVCYILAVSGTQQSGYYLNKITYEAAAKF